MIGFADVPELKLLSFIQKDGNKIQELQMTTQTGANTTLLPLMVTLMMPKPM